MKRLFYTKLRIKSFDGKKIVFEGNSESWIEFATSFFSDLLSVSHDDKKPNWFYTEMILQKYFRKSARVEIMRFFVNNDVYSDKELSVWLRKKENLESLCSVIIEFVDT